MGWIADADGVNVCIECEGPRTRSDSTKDVSHLVEVGILETEGLHLAKHSLAGQTLAAAR